MLLQELADAGQRVPRGLGKARAHLKNVWRGVKLHLNRNELAGESIRHLLHILGG